MSGDDLTLTVLELADADPSLPEEAKLLILTALEGDELFADALAGDAAPIERDVQSVGEPETAPVGAYLSAIEVGGFRGVGPALRVPLRPGPGLVVIAGRNGSGKSTIAEALEMALTGESYRWKHRSAVWTSNWRNLHVPGPSFIRVEIAEQGSGQTTIGKDWTADAPLEAGNTWVQRAGHKRESGLASLGWAGPLERYRPLLSYEELGTVLEGRPSDLFDKLHDLLGLERINDARHRLAGALKQLQAPATEAKRMSGELQTSLADSPDSRAAVALIQLRKRSPDLPLIRALATGSGTESASLEPLRRLSRLQPPDRDLLQQAARNLRNAVAAMARHTDSAADAAACRSDLLEQALLLHEEHGDSACPVCGAGELTAAWAVAARSALDSQRAELREVLSAREDLAQARREVGQIMADIEALPDVVDAGLSALTLARDTRDALLAAPDDDLALAEHVEAASTAVVTAYQALRAEAEHLLVEREDQWAPLAIRLGQWVDQAQLARDQSEHCSQVKQALDWLKTNSAELRNQRLAPLADHAKRIWATLRQESNVLLDAITLEGDATRRRVVLDAEVDGVKAGAFGVMSQGELHALALALFLPRATAPESPFRFVVLDDPIQAMDPSKVEGFVTVLAELAVDRQVIVLSHDDRLPAAVRRSAVKAQIREMSRSLGSVVTVSDATLPSMRYLDDAYALAADDGVPDDAKDRVVPGFCRMGMETSASEVFTARAYAAGMSRSTVEEQWEAARGLAQKVALALYLDRERPIKPWLQAQSHRTLALTICNRGVHSGLQGQHVDHVRDVRATLRDLRAAP